MGGGGLMQLVAYGAQDVYLTGNPQITFFKVIYRRYTNFASEAIEQTFNGVVGFGKRVSATISRNGDLITDTFVELTLKKAAGGSWYPAEQLLAIVELEIGGQTIDKHYSDFSRVTDELFRTGDEKAGYKRLTDFVDGENAGAVKRFYVPIQFFFSKNPGLALPLIALQYHECKINIQFETATIMAANGIDTAVEPTAVLYVDYVYLDTDERRRFAQVSHEYLIEQLQFTGDEAITVDAAGPKTTNVRLNFNHPVKYLAWAIRGAKYGQFTGLAPGANAATAAAVYAEANAPLYSAKLMLNGHDRFSERRGSYFNLVQPWQTLKTRPAAGIYLYSFALKPDEHQPSGTCNFSRIDNATLALTTKTASELANLAANVVSESITINAATGNNALKVFAVNYNVLRIMSGMGGLAFA